MVAALLSVVLHATPPALDGAEIAAAQERFHRALFEKVAPAVVFIATPKGFGSGVIVRNDGLILTNLHVVEEANEVDVVFHDGRKFRGRVVERAKDELDLALIQVAVKNATTLPLATNADLRVGDWVAAVGHGRGGIWTFNVGFVSNIYPDGDHRPVFQTQIPLNRGNSGGPIVSRHGEVVGVVVAGIEGANSINFGIDVSVARRSLGMLSDACDCLTVHAPASVPVFVDGKMVGTGPRVVVPLAAGNHEVFAVISGTMVRKQVQFPAVRELALEAPKSTTSPAPR